MSIAPKSNIICNADIIRHKCDSDSEEILSPTVQLFSMVWKCKKKTLIQLVIKQSIASKLNIRYISTLQFPFQPTLMLPDAHLEPQLLITSPKTVQPMLMLPDAHLEPQLLLTSPKTVQPVLMLTDAHLELQLLLNLPEDYSSPLFLCCSSDRVKILLPTMTQDIQNKYLHEKDLASSFQLLGNIAPYIYSPLFTSDQTLQRICQKISFYNDFFSNPQKYFNTICESEHLNHQLFFLGDGIGRMANYSKENLSSNISAPKSKITLLELITQDYRLCFKVQPPAFGRKRWILSLFLQSREDPSLLIPIEQNSQMDLQEGEQFPISSETTLRIPSPIDSKFIHPLIEEDLRNLAQIFTPIGQFEHNSKKIKVYLSIEQTYTFLKLIVPKLREQSFGVLIPDWWGHQESQLGIKMKVKKGEVRDINHGLLGANSQLEYKWELAIGKTGITLQEFNHMVALKQPLVKWYDKWVEMESTEIESIEEFLQMNKIHPKKPRKNKISLRRTLELKIGCLKLEPGVRVVDIEAEVGLKTLFDQFQQPKRIKPIATPDSFHGILRPYQQIGLSWMAFMHQFNFGICLADDMGLGKTIQVLAFLLHQQETYQKLIQERQLQRKRKKILPLGASLIVCPLSLIKNWVQETQKFAPSLNIYVHHGSTRVGGKTFAVQSSKCNIVITTYQQVKKDKNLLSKVLWGNILLDEAQNIKNYNTKQTKAIKYLRSNFRIALTGTPIENRLRELWSIMDFLNPGFFGTLHAFHKKYCVPIEKGNNLHKLEELQHILQPFILRRLKSDHSILRDLPNRREKKIYVNLTLEQATLYQGIVNELEERLNDAEGISRSGIILSTLLKLKQICNHPSQFLHEKNPWALEDDKAAEFYQAQFPNRSGKLKKLIQLLQPIIKNGEKAVIFTQYTQMGAFLQSYISAKLQTEVLFLNGKTPADTRDLMVRRFQQNHPNYQNNHKHQSPPIFILSLKAGGVGLNLTAANHAFHYDRWWNPAVEDQASDRIYRIGQKRDVTITKFVSSGTIEEKINLMINKKKKLSTDILNRGMGWISKMSADEIKNLFLLGTNLNPPVAI